MIIKFFFKSLLISCFLVANSNYLTAQNHPPEILTASKVETYKTVDDVDLKAWIFNPPKHEATDKTPAIVFFFGGGWVGGTLPNLLNTRNI